MTRPPARTKPALPKRPTMTAHDPRASDAAIEPILDDTPAWSEAPPPQSVPMLTEVIAPVSQPGELAPEPGALPPAPAPVSAQVPAQASALAGQVLQTLAPTLDLRISEAIARVLHEQLLGLNARVQREVAAVVKQAVAEALKQQSTHETAPGQDGHGENADQQKQD